MKTTHDPSPKAQPNPNGSTSLHFGVDLGAFVVKVGITNPVMEETSDGGLIAVANLDLLDAIQAIQSLATVYEVVIKAQNGITE